MKKLLSVVAAVGVTWALAACGASSTDKVNACVTQAIEQLRTGVDGVAPKCEGLTASENTDARQQMVTQYLTGGLGE